MAESGGGEMREGVGAAGEGEERHRSNGDGADGGTRKPEGIKKCKGIMSLQKNSLSLGAKTSTNRISI